MSDATTPAGTSVPAAPAPVPVVAVAPTAPAPVPAPPVVVAPTAPVVAAAPQEPDWLPGRLKRAEESAQAALLKSLGIDDPEAAKQAIADAKAAAEAKKTAEQRAAELDTKLRGVMTQAEKDAATIKEHAARMLMALTPEQQAAIANVAGDDPGLQLRAIHAIAPTWAKQEAEREAAAVAAAAQSAPVAPPATTSLAPTAPGSTSPGSPPDARELYNSVRSRNPFAAAAYGLANPQAYEIKR